MISSLFLYQSIREKLPVADFSVLQKKGCDRMDRKRKYRMLILWCLGLDFMIMLWLGYRYLDRRIPNEIHVQENQEKQLQKVLEHPLLTFEDAVSVSGKDSYTIGCSILGVIPFKEIKVIPSESKSVYVSGSTVGIYMETDGVLIIDTGEILSEEGAVREPAKNVVKPGDYIVAFDSQTIRSKKELIEDLRTLDGDKVELEVLRNDKIIPLTLTPVKDMQGSYKLGIWVRDNTQGIGTLTFVDDNGKYGALGHGISDVDTGKLLKIENGALYQAEILGIQKGSNGNPGELAGLIRYDSDRVIGSIKKNSENGIYGTFTGSTDQIVLTRMPMAYKQELETGPAQILCCVDGIVSAYDAEIVKIDLNHEDTNKSFVIHVTDQRLLDKTGGIVQGMSGSPVVQNGKFAGAVTHVFVQDSTSGYGIFAETMLENEKKAQNYVA